MNREKYAQRDISIERLTYRKTKDLRIEGHTHKSIDVQKGTRIERHGLRTEICTQTRNTRIEAYAVFQHRFSQRQLFMVIGGSRTNTHMNESYMYNAGVSCLKRE